MGEYFIMQRITCHFPQLVYYLLAIKLMKQLKLIADRAEKAVDSVSSAGTMLRNASGPLAIVKLVRNMVKQHKTHK